MLFRSLDPDIPPLRQRLNLQAEGSGLRWLIDGKPFAQGNNASWMPWPGKHLITLADAQGKSLDEVRIEVRGAAARDVLPTSASVKRLPKP